MYQTLGQRRNNWRRALCPSYPHGHRTIGPGAEMICAYCAQPIFWEKTRWMTARPITLVEWP